MDERKSARMFQGANVTLGGKNLSVVANTPFKELEPSDAAMLVARLMWEQQENGVYPRGVPAAISDLWPGETYSQAARKVISRYLVLNGFTPTQPYGWKVPDTFPVEWRGGGEVKVVGHKANARPEFGGSGSVSGPVTTSWLCAVHDLRFHTEGEFRAHNVEHDVLAPKARTMMDPGQVPEPKDHRRHGPSAEEQEGSVIVHRHARHADPSRLIPCGVCGTMVKASGMGGHMNGHRISKGQQQLLDAVKQLPGQHPFEYAMLLEATAAACGSRAKYLRKAGLIEVTGNKASRRWWPAGMRPSDAVAPKTTAPAPVATPVPNGAQQTAGAESEAPVKAPQMAAQGVPDKVLHDDEGNEYVLRDGRVYRKSVVTVYEEVK